MSAKGILIGLYVPLHFAVKSGHFRSAVARRAVDGRGKPIPWYTYPAVDFLSSLDFRNASVLEYGGGQSTSWWASRARTVETVETDARWAAEITSWDLRNATVVDAPTQAEFDIVIVDGGVRRENAREGLRLLAEGGILIVDNSEGDWGVPGDRYPILRTMLDEGMSRIDFNGYAPGVRRFACTSLFFRGGPAWLRPRDLTLATATLRR